MIPLSTATLEFTSDFTLKFSQHLSFLFILHSFYYFYHEDLIDKKNNIEKFEGEDCMSQLTANEFENLRCKNFTSSWGGPRYLPNAFTEQGIYMLMTALRGERAIKQRRALMRTFKQLKDGQSSYMRSFRSSLSSLLLLFVYFYFFLHIVFLLFVAHKKTLDFTSTALRKAYITASSVIDILKLSNSYCVTFHQTSYDTCLLMILLS